MFTSAISGILITLGVILLALGTIPTKNTYDGDTLTVKFIIGHKTIDMTDARFIPAPEGALRHLIRVCGTSVGSKRSGKFKNIKTKTTYHLYLTGKGEVTCFELGGKTYMVDGITPKEQ